MPPDTQYDRLMRPRAIAKPPERGFNRAVAVKLARHKAAAALLAECPGATLMGASLSEHERAAIRNRAGRIAQMRREQTNL